MNRIALLALLLTPIASADDWPQWMGPNRDNIWRETGIVGKFPEGGPKVLWRTKVAGGYAGPAVAAGRVFVTDYVTSDNVDTPNWDRKQFSGVERVLCLDESTGKPIWKHEYPVKYAVSYPAGPRCTPTIHEGKVYTLGTEGHLFCFDAESGKPTWKKQLRDDYETKTALWGYAGHPLIDGEKLICVVGGKGSHLVAFNKDTGAELWKTLTAKEQGYSPPTIIEAGGTRQLITTSAEFVASVDPESGKPFWQVPYQATSGSIIMTPIQFEDYLFVGGYNRKNLLVKLGRNQPTVEVVWQDEARKAISPVNVQPFRVGDVIYGANQSGQLLCFDIVTGKRLWESPEVFEKGARRPSGNSTAFIVQNQGRFVFFNERGELVLGKMSKEGYTEIDRAKVIEPSNRAAGRKVVWSAPAYANRHAYIRNDNELICVDLSDSK